MDFLAQYLCVCCLIVGSMASSKVIDFFPEIKGNLSQVTWAHAVNNGSHLSMTLENNSTMMIEADVTIGEVGNEKNTTIMAHPPDTKSDLSLSDFLDKVNSFNEAVENKTRNGTKKGIKLDFKSTSALEKAVDSLKNYTSNGTFPVWINADIIAGPINATVEPVNATKFFELTKDISNIVLSVGWTTNYNSSMTGQYESKHISLMISTINNTKVTTEITFPVRAGLAAESSDEMRRLLQEVKNSTLTLWSSEHDNVNITKLNNLLFAIGAEKMYIDVPESLQKQLNFNGSSSSNSSTTTPSPVTTTVTTYTSTSTTNSTSSNTAPHNHTSPSTKAPNKNSANILRFGTLSLLFGVIICLL